MSKTYVTFPGDANDENTFGGTSYYLLDALKECASSACGLNLHRSLKLRMMRYSWNAVQLLKLRGIGGYQYSNLYLDEIWREKCDLADDDVLLNLFQLYANWVFDLKCRKVFYIDMTLKQMFAEYGTLISPRQQQYIVNKERINYRRADAVICMCRWAADSLRQEYGIAESKIFVVLPGANIDRQLIKLADEHFEADEWRENVNAPVKFLFVGKDPERKGLFRFLDAMRLIPDYAVHMHLTVIGPGQEAIPASYRNMVGVNWLGFIDKKNKGKLYIDLLLQHDIGILLSRAEATGISLREFQLAGLGVLAPNVGGSPEMVASGAGLLIEKNDTSTDIAAKITRLVTERDLMRRMKLAAREFRNDMRWDRTANEIQNILDGLKQPS